MKKRFLSMLLVLVMVIGMIPFSALSASAESVVELPDGYSYNILVKEPVPGEKPSYDVTIEDTVNWADFKAKVVKWYKSSIPSDSAEMSPNDTFEEDEVYCVYVELEPVSGNSYLGGRAMINGEPVTKWANKGYTRAFGLPEYEADTWDKFVKYMGYNIKTTIRVTADIDKTLNYASEGNVVCNGDKTLILEGDITVKVQNPILEGTTPFSGIILNLGKLTVEGPGSILGQVDMNRLTGDLAFNNRTQFFPVAVKNLGTFKMNGGTIGGVDAENNMFGALLNSGYGKTEINGGVLQGVCNYYNTVIASGVGDAEDTGVYLGSFGIGVIMRNHNYEGCANDTVVINGGEIRSLTDNNNFYHTYWIADRIYHIPAFLGTGLQTVNWLDMGGWDNTTIYGGKFTSNTGAKITWTEHNNEFPITQDDVCDFLKSKSFSFSAVSHSADYKTINVTVNLDMGFSFLKPTPDMPQEDWDELSSDLGTMALGSADTNINFNFGAKTLPADAIEAGYSVKRALKVTRDDITIYDREYASNEVFGWYLKDNIDEGGNYHIIPTLNYYLNGVKIEEISHLYTVKVTSSIPSASITVPEPVEGLTPADVNGTLNTGCLNINKETWYVNTGSGYHVMSDNEPFVAGKQYRYEAFVLADSGYMLANDFTMEINGKRASGNGGFWKSDVMTAKAVLTATTPNDEITLIQGSSTTFEVDAKGDGLSYTWKAAEGAPIITSGDTSYRATIYGSKAGTFTYTCTVTDKYRETEVVVTFTLTVEPNEANKFVPAKPVTDGSGLLEYDKFDSENPIQVVQGGSITLTPDFSLEMNPDATTPNWQGQPESMYWGKTPVKGDWVYTWQIIDPNTTKTIKTVNDMVLVFDNDLLEGYDTRTLGRILVYLTVQNTIDGGAYAYAERWIYIDVVSDGSVVEGTVEDDPTIPAMFSMTSKFAGVTVHLVDANGNIKYFTTVDENGYYRFTGVQIGEYKLQVELEGYEDYSEDISVSTNEATITKTVMMTPHICHKNDNGTNVFNANPADCATGTNGNIEYYICECGKYYGFIDSDYQYLPNGIDDTIVYPVHDYGTKVEAQGYVHTATELKGSVAAHYFCDVCDTYFDESYVATTLEALTSEAPAHSYTTINGYKESDGHANTCSCGAHDTVVPHTPNIENATEDEDKKCTECGYIIQNKLSHTHVLKPVAEVGATCTTDGVKAYYACDCGSHYAEDAEGTKIIENLSNWKLGNGKIAAAHTPNADDGDCTTEITCSVCGETTTAASTHTDTNTDGKCDTCGKDMPKADDPSAPTPDLPNTNTDKETNATDATENEKDDSTETEAPVDKGCGGCGSSAALSALALVGVIGTALVIKKKED